MAAGRLDATNVAIARWAWLSWPRGTLHVNQFSPLTKAGDMWFGRDMLCAGE